jgi:CheY-like chemotaxis protein
LLAFARKQTVMPKVLDLNETVAGMLTMLRRLIGEDIELIWQPGLELWPVKVDPSQIDQILANLCVNARDAIRGVGEIIVETTNVTITGENGDHHIGVTAGDYVRITLCDNGPGMQENVVAHIFEPFYTTKGVGEGTGLGLATVYGAIKQNNGFIFVDSEEGRGTTFTIYLPRHQNPAVKEEENPPSEPAQGGRECILLVEDEETILQMTATLLQHLGYRVLAANSPEEAFRLADSSTEKIHLLLTDVVMPQMNGREMAEKLAIKHAGMKCLFMSGYTADIISHHGVLDEGVYFMQKPFSKAELATKIRTALQEPL